MDSFEIDSEASLDSFHLNSEDFNISSPSPHPPNPELTSKIQELELEIEKLKLSFENSKTETNSLKASNKGLKSKIGELFQEAQFSIQDKLKLENILKDKQCQLSIIENSSKWYQLRLHESEATNKSLKSDLEIYQRISSQREQSISELIEKCEENDKLKIRVKDLEEKYVKERENWKEEMHHLVKNNKTPKFCSSLEMKNSEELIKELRKKIDEMERQLEIAEKRYLNVEMLRNLEENSSLKCRKELEKMREEFGRMEVEKNELMEELRIVKGHGEDLRIENERLSVVLLACKREKVEVEEGIVELRLQLMKMIAQYKALKSRNVEAEKKLGSLREVERENRRLKARSVAVDNSLLRKIKEEKRKCKIMEGSLKEERAKSVIDYQRGETVSSMTICLQQALNREKDLKDRLKLLSKSSDESVDEGYGDSAGFSDVVALSSPSPVNSALMNFAVNVLMRSQNFMAPVDSSLRELESNIKKLSIGSESINFKCR